MPFRGTVYVRRKVGTDQVSLHWTIRGGSAGPAAYCGDCQKHDADWLYSPMYTLWPFYPFILNLHVLMMLDSLSKLPQSVLRKGSFANGYSLCTAEGWNGSGFATLDHPWRCHGAALCNGAFRLKSALLLHGGFLPARRSRLACPKSAAFHPFA